MSENLQINFVDSIKNVNELNAVDQKNSNVMDSDNCETSLEKLKGSPCFNACEKVQKDLNIVRNCLQNLMQMGKKTNDALMEGTWQ